MSYDIDDLWMAICWNDVRAVRYTLDKRPELVEATDDLGLTPLMQAAGCCSRSAAMIRTILDAGADVNRQTADGTTALHCAIDVDGEANLNTHDVIAVIVAAGADLRMRQGYGWTPLLKAVATGTFAEVEALLATGADPNETIPLDTLPSFMGGYTTLMAAITNPDAEEVIKALLDAGADPFRPDLYGRSFFHLVEAKEREYERCGFGKEVERCGDLVRKWLEQHKST